MYRLACPGIWLKASFIGAYHSSPTSGLLVQQAFCQLPQMLRGCSLDVPWTCMQTLIPPPPHFLVFFLGRHCAEPFHIRIFSPATWRSRFHHQLCLMAQTREVTLLGQEANKWTKLEFEPMLVWLQGWLRCAAVMAENTGFGIRKIWGFDFLCGFQQVIKVPKPQFAYL